MLVLYCIGSMNVYVQFYDQIWIPVGSGHYFSDRNYKEESTYEKLIIQNLPESVFISLLVDLRLEKHARICFFENSVLKIDFVFWIWHEQGDFQLFQEFNLFRSLQVMASKIEINYIKKQNPVGAPSTFEEKILNFLENCVKFSRGKEKWQKFKLAK